MRLKNKITGEIGELLRLYWNDETKQREIGVEVGNSARWYASLAELCEEWEDYEEPKKYWYIYGDDILSADDDNDFMANSMKTIGNYFETEEEAERTVEKLKAWKRLRYKWSKFKQWGCLCAADKRHMGIDAEMRVGDDDARDLDLLFGGEDD